MNGCFYSIPEDLFLFLTGCSKPATTVPPLDAPRSMIAVAARRVGDRTFDLFSLEAVCDDGATKKYESRAGHRSLGGGAEHK